MSEPIDPAATITPTEAGYYWIRSRWSGRWSVAKFDGSDELQWTFIGSDYLIDSCELLGPENDDQDTFVLGPRIEEP